MITKLRKEKFDFLMLKRARRYTASSFFGLSKITVFKLLSSRSIFFSLLNIFAKYKYDFSFLGLNTIAFSNLNLESLYFLSSKSSFPSSK